MDVNGWKPVGIRNAWSFAYASMACDSRWGGDKEKWLLKSEQWKLAEDLVKILEPFNIVTTFLSYEENVAISLHGVIDQLKPSIDPADSTAIRQF